MVQYTEQQRRAIETRDSSVALSAGAGCGKTFVLTQRFLQELEPRPGRTVDLSSLVAITFTDRAAREMRERVRRTCRQRLADCPDAEVDHWQRLVRDLDTARISTIHSFCYTLLRGHAIEAGIDPQSRLFDEITGTTFRQQAIREELRELLIAGDLDARAVVGDLGWELACERITQLVPQRYRLQPEDWVDRTPTELLAHWQTVLEREALPAQIAQFLESGTVRRVVQLVGGPQSANDKMRERCQYLAQHLPQLARARDSRAALDNVRANAQIKGAGKAADWPDPALHEEAKEAFKALRAEVDKLLESLTVDTNSGVLAAELSLAALRLTVEIGHRYDLRKRADSWLDFDDLLTGARNLLRDHPRVCRRVGDGIRLLMVDEFQDTDRLQAEIVRRLCGTELTTGKLFLVGDIKQSIYRFRRAEPRVFRQLRADLPEPGRLPLTGNFRSQPAILQFVNALCDGALGDEYEPLTPQTPQLSTEPCIEFLFPRAGADTLGDAPGGDDSGAGDTGETETDNRGGGPDLAADPKAAERRALEAHWIARRIRGLLEEGAGRIRERSATAPAGYELRRVEPRDVVLLFRAMNDVPLYENALRELGIPHYVVGGKAFYAQQEVYDVVNLLRVLDEPDDLVALVGVLRSPWFGCTDDEIFAAGFAGLIEPVAARLKRRASGEPDPSADRHRDASRPAPNPDPADPRTATVREALQVLHELRQLVPRQGLAELLQNAIDRTGFDAALLTEFLGERKLANLRKLLEQARSCDLAGQSNLSDFARLLLAAVVEESRESLAAIHPESGNVVRLMTIHQSKGLEFPVVFVADMNRKGRGGPEGAILDDHLGPLLPLPPRFARPRPNLGRDVLAMLESPEELCETQRLLYVATTRAADLLILSGTLHEKRGRLQLEHPWMRLLSDRFDLESGAPSQNPANPVLISAGRDLPEIRVHHQPPAISAAPGPARERGSHLVRWLERIDATDPTELPPELQRFAPDLRHRRRFSVSQLESRLEACPPAERPPEADWSDLLDRVEVDWPSRTGRGAGGQPLPHLPQEEATELGTLVHKVLEMGGDPRESLRRLLASSLPPRSPALQELAGHCIDTVLDDPRWAELRSLPLASREVEFLIPRSVAGTACHVVGKIDALIRDPQGWRVIDYKTGHIPPRADFARVMLAKYALQLGVYSLAIADWTGQPAGPLELVWLPRGERLRFQPDPAFLARIERLLDWCLAQAHRPDPDEEHPRPAPVGTESEDDPWQIDRG